MREAASVFGLIGLSAGPGSREIELAASGLVGAMSGLKDQGDFLFLDIEAIDRQDYYEVVYRLLDMGGEGGVGIITLRVNAPKAEPSLPSLVAVWKAADVLEREVWDLMGVVFTGRDKLKRILCKDDFEGHPLRKDFVVAPRTPRFADGVEGAKA
jgi:NADH-quinone oxidoreductase subunit C